MNQKKVQVKFRRIEEKYQDSFELFCRLTNNGNNISLLMESRSINLKYGKQSIIVPNPAIKITGKNEDFVITALTPAGKEILKCFDRDDFSYADEYTQEEKIIKGKVIKEENRNTDESRRVKLKNVSRVLRTILNKFETENNYCGLYGAFAYDFARNFYKIGDKFKEDGSDDFIFFIPTIVYVFDDIKERLEILEFSFNGFKDYINHSTEGFNFIKQEHKTSADMDEEEYNNKVEKIIQEIKNGRVMQCVLSRKIGISLQEHPIKSYEKLRKSNPSPYSFFYNFGNNEILYGASPERHIAIENNNIEIRPIAGTVQRSDNPMQDAKARIKLLTDRKELREHSMLVDLARNEIYHLSEPKSVRITDLFSVEVYPNIYHMVSGVNGKLKKGIDVIDAMLVTLPAGTLSGAPKLEAMKMIEEYECSRREFYGGAVGLLSFNGYCNTGITIRCVHVKNNTSYVRAGGGIVSLSTPERELEETKLKMEKALKVLEVK